jgi:hypothetical protein
MASRVRRNAIDNTETTSPVLTTSRIIFLHVSMVFLALARVSSLIVWMTEFTDPVYVIGVREVSAYLNFASVWFAFVVLTVVYHKGATVVYGKRTSVENLQY